MTYGGSWGSIVSCVVLYDEWDRFDNRNYDVSFHVSQARFDPSYSHAAYTIAPSAPGGGGSIRLSSSGTENQAELARIRKAAAESPSIEIADLTGARPQRAITTRAELVDWLDGRPILAVQDGQLVVYDGRGVKLHEVAIRVRSAADVFVR
jgi:hypothetical protein